MYNFNDFFTFFLVAFFTWICMNLILPRNVQSVMILFLASSRIGAGKWNFSSF